MAEKKWTAVIKSKDNPFKLNIKEHWKYRDLIWLFVKRDFKTRYKQTVLGPLWFIIAPLFNTVIYTLIFGEIAGLAEAGTPTMLFYMIGNLTWTFFTGSFNAGQTALAGNAGLFSKVYFPRLVPTISTLISNLINFGIQFLMFIGFMVYYILVPDYGMVNVNWIAALTPLFLLQLSVFGMGVGLIISSFTVKYRDLLVLVSFGLSAWMYITPIIFSASQFNVYNDAGVLVTPAIDTLIYKVFMCNPVSPVVELMRYGWLGCGTTPWLFYGISWGVTLIISFLGIVAFNKTQKNFLDTV